MSFRARMDQTSRKRETSIVLAFDFPFEKPEESGRLFSKAERFLELVHTHFCAVKFNHHLVLPLGLFDGVQTLVKKAHDLGLMAVMDCKVNDIGATNEVVAEYYYSAGFDALIANPFIGWEEGLEPIFRVAGKRERGVILLVYMSHKGATEGYGQMVYDSETGEKIPQYILFARKALKYDADGVVVGATFPERIREVKEMLDEKVPIYSPGIGTQGGRIQMAMQAGARYAIIGREVTLAKDPAEAARRFRHQIESVRR